MTQSEHETLMRCHDFLVSFKLFEEACARITDDDIAFMKKAHSVTARYDEQTKEANRNG